MLRLRDFMIGLLIGSMAGALTMMFFAPKSGKRMRAKLQHQVEDLREQMAEGIEETEEEVLAQAHRVVNNVRDTMTDLQHRGKAVVSSK